MSEGLRVKRKKEPKGLSAGQKAVLAANEKASKYKRCPKCGLRVKSERHKEGLAHNSRTV